MLDGAFHFIGLRITDSVGPPSTTGVGPRSRSCRCQPHSSARLQPCLQIHQSRGRRRRTKQVKTDKDQTTRLPKSHGPCFPTCTGTSKKRFLTSSSFLLSMTRTTTTTALATTTRILWVSLFAQTSHAAKSGPAESSRSRLDTIISKDTTRGFIISIASDVAFSVILLWKNRIRKECHTELRSGAASTWSPLHSHGIWTISAHMKATYAKDANMGAA